MTIFLHFLNREAYRAANTSYSVADIEIGLRVLTVARCDELFTNFSNLLEGGLLAVGGPAIVRELIRLDQILIEGERPSLPEFIESRASLYEFDSARYPMYFAKSSLSEELRPRSVRQNSITARIETEILDISQHKKGLEQIGISMLDSQILGPAIPQLSDIVKHRESNGITRSLFAGKLGGQQQEAAASRLISTVYLRRYQHDLDCEIATGIPSLAVFDPLATDSFATNVQVLKTILVASGFRENFCLSRECNDIQYASLRATEAQVEFSKSVRFLCAILSHIFPGVNSARAAIETNRVIKISNPHPLLDNVSLYAVAQRNLLAAIGRLRQNNKVFSQAYEGQMVLNGFDKTVLLVTATKAESQALITLAEELTRTPCTYLARRHYVVGELGQLNNMRLLYVQCEPGSVGPSSSQGVITEAIQDFSPNAVILGGIAFGTNSAKQSLGDVLVSKVLVEYEKAKITAVDEIPRGQRIEASPKLLSLFRAAESAGLHAHVHFGVMLSGEKLIDSEGFLANLLRREPEAIGGEMEGAGLVSAAQRSGTDWVVVKAIVDWASNKQAQNDPDHQFSIAKNAFNFILQALARIGL